MSSYYRAGYMTRGQVITVINQMNWSKLSEAELEAISILAQTTTKPRQEPGFLFASKGEKDESL